jgi:hypothetical protein
MSVEESSEAAARQQNSLIIERLRQDEGRVRKITGSDQELLAAKIVHVDDEYRNAFYDRVSSTRPGKYKPGAASAYAIGWDDIVDSNDFEAAPAIELSAVHQNPNSAI